MKAFRRFGTAKRLKLIVTDRESGFHLIIFKGLEHLYPIKYNLTFGSAKPTGAL